MGIRAKQRNERGQVSVLLGTMLLTLMLFFAFVVNTGMLVNAKINLQNAADLAAYSGAAVQARQLTQISYLNYEMRRVLKKFLFRYYVVGGMAQQTHPKSASGGVREWGPKPGETIGVPTVCVTFNQGDNYCQMSKLPDIPIPPKNALDQITNVLHDQLTQINNMRRLGCVGIGKTNVALLYYWLWNTDPELKAVETELSKPGNPPELVNRLRALRTLASGLGLVPQEMLLRKRIKTLNGYVNYASQTDLDKKGADSLKSNKKDWAAKERPIQAFYSAYYTLGGSTFPAADIKLTEILPKGGDGSKLLALKDLEAEFDAYAIDMNVGTSCTATSDNDPSVAPGAGDCVQCLVPFSLNKKRSNLRAVFGVAKDPSVLTYYAVKLEAKAQLMFSPWGPIKLTAFSAAQPFGSRIGPQNPEFTEEANVEQGAGAFQVKAGQLQTANQILNLPIGETEGKPSLQNGWNMNDVLFSFYQGFNQVSGGVSTGIPPSLGAEDMLRAYQIAMVPNPYESGKYNIPNDLASDDPFVKHFDERGLHAIWAPLFDSSSTAANSNPAQEVADMIDQIAPQDSTSQAAFDNTTKEALKKGITEYVGSVLKAGKGENGEGLNIYRFYDPFRRYSTNSTEPAAPIAGIPPSIYMKEKDRVKTSWNDVPSSRHESPGRTGYSVKYVPLKMLRTPTGITTDGTGTMSNRLPAADGLDDSIDFIQH